MPQALNHVVAIVIFSLQCVCDSSLDGPILRLLPANSALVVPVSGALQRGGCSTNHGDSGEG